MYLVVSKEVFTIQMIGIRQMSATSPARKYSITSRPAFFKMRTFSQGIWRRVSVWFSLELVKAVIGNLIHLLSVILCEHSRITGPGSRASTQLRSPRLYLGGPSERLQPTPARARSELYKLSVPSSPPSQ